MDGEVVFWAASIQKHKSREVSVESQHSLSVGTKLSNKRRRGLSYRRTLLNFPRVETSLKGKLTMTSFRPETPQIFFYKNV